MKSWLEQLLDQDGQGNFDTSMLDRNHNRWKARRNHVEKVIKCAKHSMPGPAGIPALACKVLGPLAVEVLWEALEVLSGVSGVEILRAAYDGMSPEQCYDLTLSMLRLLPKRASWMR